MRNIRSLIFWLSAAAVFVAAVAIHAVVHVPADALVLVIGLIFRVAIRALKDAVIAWIGVADGAHSIRSAVVGVEPGVIEGRAQPTAGAMARGTGCRKTCRNVIRIRRAAIVLRMAAVAVGRQRRVVVVYVATGAGRARVRAGQRETRVVVIERRLRPGGRVVADVALLGETDRHVVRIIGVLKVGEVAGHARRVCQSVGIGACVALAALQR